MNERTPDTPGMVYLVGAGPGDPGLITLKGWEYLHLADVILHDHLVHPDLYQFPKDEKIETINVGKRPGQPSISQEEINQLLIDYALQGKKVVRLKGGDPYIFGRGGEEAQALAEAGISFEVVSGITAAQAASAYAGIPLTHRHEVVSTVFVTGHEDPDKGRPDVDWAKYVLEKNTLCIYMGVGRLRIILQELLDAGLPRQTPAAAVFKASLPGQKVIESTAEKLADRAEKEHLKPPAVILLTPTVKLRTALNWFEKQPLFGKTIVVTRPSGSKRVVFSGANIINLPMLEIVPIKSWDKLDAAIREIENYDWIVWTSERGVEPFMDRLFAVGRDARALHQCKIAAIGENTKEALLPFHLIPDLIPENYTSESLASALIKNGGLGGKKILLPRSEIGGDELPKMLKAAGARVDDISVYRALKPGYNHKQIRETLGAVQVDWVTVTAPSITRNFVETVEPVLGTEWLNQVKWASIGPVTSEALRELGLTPAVEADPHTVEALVKAVVEREFEEKED